MILMNKHNEDLVVISIDITLACNNRCEYCYALSYLDNKKLINDEVFYDSIKSINEFKKNYPNKKLKIDILGGDPLLVIDRVAEFIENTYSEDIFYTIFTNLNYNTNSNSLKQVKELLQKYKNIMLNISWHKSSKQENLKNNIIELDSLNILIIFLIKDSNFEEIYNDMLWLRKNTNSNYDLEFLRDKNSISELTDFNNYYYKELKKYSFDNNYKNMLDDREYLISEILEMGLLDVAKKFKTICKLSQLKIDYDGNLKVICSNPIVLGNIKDGIIIKDILCNKYSCLCSTNNFKKLF